MRPPAFGFRLSRVPASALLAVLLLWAFSAGTAWSQPYEITPASREAIPDLNQLQERVLEFWSLLSRGEKYQALGYVAEGQDHFLNWKWPSVQSYRVANLELKDGSGEVVVTIQATTQAPGFETTINWPVRQRWAFREDAWRILVQGSNLAALFGGTSPGPAKPSPDQAETLQQLKLFQIGRQRIHFGEVLQGDVVWQEIFYKNESGIEINARVGEAPGWIALDRSHFVVPPGEGGTLLLGVFTEQLEGEIKGTLTLELIHGEARHTQTVPVLGSVQVPLSLVPARLVLMPGVVQEVQVRNTTQDAVRIAEVLMPADFLVSEWAAGSAQIGPGSHSVLKIRWDEARTPESWPGGIIRLLLTQPLGGRTTLTIPVLPSFP